MSASASVPSWPSADYARYRPSSYPRWVYDSIRKAVGDGDASKRVGVDVGCGPQAQASRQLLEHGIVGRVIAVDSSPSQLSDGVGSDHAAVERRIGSAEQLPVSDGVVDVVIAAQAAHWFDMRRYHAELQRLARNSNTVAVVIGYGLNWVADRNANELVADFYDNVLGEYWDARRHHLDSADALLKHLQSAEAPSGASWTSIEPPAGSASTMELRMPLHAFINYVGTWSALKAYREHVRKSTTTTTEQPVDVLDVLASKLEAIYGSRDTELVVTWPLFTFMLANFKR